MKAEIVLLLNYAPPDGSVAMVGAKIILTGAKIFAPAHEECDMLDHLPRVQLRHSWGEAILPPERSAKIPPGRACISVQGFACESRPLGRHSSRSDESHYRRAQIEAQSPPLRL